jgi:hypothetical protein
VTYKPIHFLTLLHILYRVFCATSGPAITRTAKGIDNCGAELSANNGLVCLEGLTWWILGGGLIEKHFATGDSFHVPFINDIT